MIRSRVSASSSVQRIRPHWRFAALGRVFGSKPQWLRSVSISLSHEIIWFQLGMLWDPSEQVTTQIRWTAQPDGIA